MNSKLVRILVLLAVLLASQLLLAGCETMEGLGRDTQEAGEAIEEEADEEEGY